MHKGVDHRQVSTASHDTWMVCINGKWVDFSPDITVNQDGDGQLVATLESPLDRICFFDKWLNLHSAELRGSGLISWN